MSAPAFRALARKAAQLYPARERFARHFAFGKLTGDPVFRRILELGLIAPGARVLDLGCGQGVLEALLVAAQDAGAGTLEGIDFSARDVERARSACGLAAKFSVGDIRTAAFGAADTVVILDVLHYIDFAAQEDVLRRVRAAHGRRGLLLLRVGDMSRSLRFRITATVDRAAMALRGHRIERFCARPVREWQELLETLGYQVDPQPMSEGTPFANVLLVARYHSR